MDGKVVWRAAPLAAAFAGCAEGSGKPRAAIARKAEAGL